MAAVVFAVVRAGACAAGIVLLAAGEVVAPDLAVAVLVRLPASMSACVTEYEPAQVRNAPGARPPAGQVTLAILLSDTVTGEAIVVLPVFVTL